MLLVVVGEAILVVPGLVAEAGGQRLEEEDVEEEEEEEEAAAAATAAAAVAAAAKRANDGSLAAPLPAEALRGVPHLEGSCCCCCDGALGEAGGSLLPLYGCSGVAGGCNCSWPAL